MRYLPVNIENIEQVNDRFAVDIKGEEFIFEIFWNKQGEFFSLNLYDRREEAIIVGRKIVYEADILSSVVDERLPEIQIVPTDKSGMAEKTGITLDNFGKSVKLVVIDNG